MKIANPTTTVWARVWRGSLEVALSLVFWVGALLVILQCIVFVAVILATVAPNFAPHFRVFSSGITVVGGFIILGASFIAMFHKSKEKLRAVWVFMGLVGIFVIVTELIGWP